MGSALAKIGGKRLPDLVFGRMAIPGKKGRRLHDHAVDAVAALRGLFVDECLLQRVGVFSRPKTFESDDFGIGHGGNRHHAAAQCLPVVVHGASPALRQPTAKVKPVQSKMITQRVQQRHVGIVHTQDLCFAVDRKLYVRLQCSRQS